MLTALEKLAFEVSLKAPIYPRQSNVYVPRGTINKIRNELTRRGYDWKKASKIYRKPHIAPNE